MQYLFSKIRFKLKTAILLTRFIINRVVQKRRTKKMSEFADFTYRMSRNTPTKCRPSGTICESNSKWKKRNEF